MSTEDRMKAILAKQAAADKAAAEEEARLAVATRDAKALRSQVEQKWSQLSTVLSETIKTANASMAGRTLYVAYENLPPGGMLVSELVFSFENKPPNRMHPKCGVRVNPDGTIIVSIDNAVVSPKKTYRLDALAATKKQIEGIVFDFLELNI
jgi:hypothetical protein